MSIEQINYEFPDSSMIKNTYCEILEDIAQKIDINLNNIEEEMKEIHIYDILDGTRTTAPYNLKTESIFEVPLFSISMIHALKALGANKCSFLIHTSYNRLRGNNEFDKILKKIELGSSIIKSYALENDIRCNCVCTNNNYELIHLLEDIEEATINGNFDTFFFFDYDESWYRIQEGYEILKKIPDINVHIRHTKFNFSGALIPEKMKKSAFVYSQNGSIYSNWDNREILTLISIALLAKKLNDGESLEKVYSTHNERRLRNKKREVELFQKTIYLKDYPTKFSIIGSPFGTFQFYY